MSTSNRCWAQSTARSQPELPAPTTSTRSPASWSVLRYAPEWICNPAKVPGTAGTFGSHRCPFATRTPSYSAVSPDSSVTCQPAEPSGPSVGIGVTARTAVLNRMTS